MVENKSGSYKTNLIGERFGRLVVVNLSEERIKDALTYECLCDCGKRVLATSVKLRAGKVTTCGDCFLSRSYRAEESNYVGYLVLMRTDCADGKIYLGKSNRYDRKKHYNNADNSLIYISENKKMFSLLCSTGFAFSQQELIDKGVFTEEDYAEFASLKVAILNDLEAKREIKFSINLSKLESGVPFSYPDWDGKQESEINV